MASHDAIVIGGGLLGSATAYHLVRAGLRTALVDRADRGRATDAGAGILSPETNSRDSDPWFELAAEAVDHYPALIEALGEAGAGETGYARCGKLVVAISESDVERFARARQIVFGRRDHRGRPSPEDLHEISPREARALFPPLAEVRAALYSRHAARVDGRLLNAALQAAAVAKGLTILRGSVERLVIERDAVTGVILGGQPLSASSVTIAGGAWSATFARQLRVDIPVAPQRGQIVHFGLPGVDTSTWPMANAFSDHYLVSWPDSRVAGGATRETGSGFAPHTTAAGVREVLDEVLRVAPGLSGAEIIEVRVGLRPATPDGLPVLGPVPGVADVFLATGHGPTGLSLGPYSAKLVADLITGGRPARDLGPFSVARWAGAAR
jgi:D-amino-acid dehydrogenase